MSFVAYCKTQRLLVFCYAPFMRAITLPGVCRKEKP
jgi:hypothetical protein